MQRSIFLARLIGPFLAVCGVALVFNAESFRAIGDEIVRSPAMIYLAGVIALAAGLAIVNTHNEWTTEWPVAVTLIGWLCVFAGFVRLVFPRNVAALGTSVISTVSNNWIIGEGVVILALGAWLSFKGYGPKPARPKRKR